jgi:hypothetical protein
MFKLILKVILIGLLAGGIVSVVIMMIGSIIYFLFSALDLFLNIFFLESVAWVAVIAGVLCCISLYLYVLFSAIKFCKKTAFRYMEK